MREKGKYKIQNKYTIMTKNKNPYHYSFHGRFIKMCASHIIHERVMIVRLFSNNENARSGRSTILSEAKLEGMEEMVSTNLQLFIRRGAVQAEIRKIAMKQFHFKPYRPTLIVYPNENDFDLRSEFCKV